MSLYIDRLINDVRQKLQQRFEKSPCKNAYNILYVDSVVRGTFKLVPGLYICDSKYVVLAAILIVRKCM